MQLIGGGGRESTNLLRMINLPWQGFDRKPFTKIEALAGMAQRQVIYLTIKQVFQKEIKERKKQKSTVWRMVCSNRKGKKTHIYFTLYDSINDMKHF